MAIPKAVEVIHEFRHLAAQGCSRQEASYEALLVRLRDLLQEADNDGLRTAIHELHERVRILRRTRNTLPEFEHDAYIENYKRTGRPKIIGIGREVLGRRRDGSNFPMELAVSEFHIGERRYFTGIVRDITERKRLEDQLRRRLADLDEADRQKNEFLAMLGHELRNPLAPMRNALYLLRLGQPDSAAVAEAQAMIERQLQHLVRLVDDLLDVSRIIRGKIDLRKERIDLAQVVRRAVETAQPTIDANGHELEVTVPTHPLWIMGDLIRLAQVVSNLLTNSAKYTTRSGRIQVILEQADGSATISVRDHGDGIAPELLPRVFDLFVQGEHTLARSQGGLGIGLTLVRRLVDMHGGEAKAKSAGRGQGSEFVVSLPLLPESRNPPVQAAPRRAQSTTSKRVLVVDDNADAANSTARILAHFGHDVRCVYDGPAAIVESRAFHPDIVVLDIGLPGMDGYEVAKRLRGIDGFRRTALIAVTGYGQDEDRARSREAGFDYHLAKPIDPEVLADIIALADALT